MIAVGHSAIGVIIGTVAIKIFRPELPPAAMVAVVFIIALVAHYAMDFVPHGHYYIDYKRLDSTAMSKFLLDLVGGVMLFSLLTLLKYGLVSIEFWLIIVAIGASQLTDAFEALVSFKLIPRWGWVRSHSQFHSLMHWHDEETSPLPGGARPIRWTDIWQVATVAVALLLLLR